MRKRPNYASAQQMSMEHLEPRVAMLEVNLEAQTKNLDTLTNIVRDQGAQTERQLQELMVAVANAAAPKKTDWFALLSVAIGAVMLIMALGAAVLSPMYLQYTDLKRNQDALSEKFDKHTSLTLHPVGETRINIMEKDLQTASARNTEAIKEVDNKLEYHIAAAAANTRAEMDELRKDFSVVRDQGSPITRERLAVLEEKVNRLSAIVDNKAK